MAKTPDPSYWGNPPETPRSKYDPHYTPYQQPSTPQPTQQPLQQSVQQPAPQPIPQAAQQSIPQPEAIPTAQATPTAAPQADTVATPQAVQANQTTQAAPTTQVASSTEPRATQEVQAEQPESTSQAQQPFSVGSSAQPTEPYQQPHQPHSTTSPGGTPPREPFGTQQQTPKSKKPLIIGIIVAVILLVVLGIAGCSALGAFYSINNEISSEINHHENSIEDDRAYDETASLNIAFREYFNLDNGSEHDEAALSTQELDSIQDHVFHHGSKSPNKEGEYEPGVYYVGEDLPAGSYWFEGDDEHLSSFFILQPSSTTDGAYDVVHINDYYGHNLMDLKEGEVFILDNHDSMEPLSKMDETFTDPYTSGTYRVGTDIPAGTYYVAADNAANDYCAYYIMTDLKFNDSSYRDIDYLIEGDEPLKITLKEGEYIELYNMTMSSTANKTPMGTKTHV